MTDSIQVDAGLKEILINKDPERVIRFNPLDLLFAEKFYALLGDFHEKDIEYQKRMKVLEKEGEKDKFGLPENLPKTFKLMNDMCDYLFEQIDNLFGKGTSKMIFEGAKNLEMIQQFFDGMVPHIQKARSVKVEKYTGPKKK